jgi:hypothetical protein
MKKKRTPEAVSVPAKDVWLEGNREKIACIYVCVCFLCMCGVRACMCVLYVCVCVCARSCVLCVCMCVVCAWVRACVCVFCVSSLCVLCACARARARVCGVGCVVWCVCVCIVNGLQDETTKHGLSFLKIYRRYNIIILIHGWIKTRLYSRSKNRQIKVYSVIQFRLCDGECSSPFRAGQRLSGNGKCMIWNVSTSR